MHTIKINMIIEIDLEICLTWSNDCMYYGFESAAARRGSLGVVSWTSVSVLALKQRFNSNAWHAFCCHSLSKGLSVYMYYLP